VFGMFPLPLETYENLYGMFPSWLETCKMVIVFT
jgi:hypothetical protein